MKDDGNLIKLPEPPSQLEALLSCATASLDVTIKWVVDSGSIVQQGERIARLSYSPHGKILQSGSVSKADAALAPRSTIRARVKKRGVSNNEAADRSNTSKPSSSDPVVQSGEESNGVSMDIRSPFSGFLNILYSNDIINNAIQINPNQESNHYAATDLILAAVEPCQHPALVGSLCAVCGTDTRASVIDLALSEDDAGKESKHEQQQIRKILRREHGDTRPKKGCLRDGSENKADSQDTETCAVDNSLTNQPDENQDNSISKLNTAESTCEMKTQTKHHVKTVASSSSSIRSLSSLLSGAKTTQEMQQTQRTLPRRNVSIERPPATYFVNSKSGSSDSNMTQMTVSGGVTLTISEAERKSISEADSKKLRQSKQLCLVLDLDHTLLHATDDYRAARFVAEEIIVDEANEYVETNGKKPPLKTKPNPQKRKDVRSILLPYELPQYQQYVQRYRQEQQQYFDQNGISMPPIPDQKLRHFVKLRPHLKEFFDAIQSTYKLSVYTAGNRAYAEKIAVMICRHLVGALLDEEGLNALRVKVREKDGELKRYRARLGRKQQLKMAKERDSSIGCNLPESTGTTKAKKKGVSFSFNSNVGSGEKPLNTNEDKSTDSTPNRARREEELVGNDIAPSLDAESTSKSDEELLAQKVNGSLNVGPDKSDNETSQCIPKRTMPRPEATNGGQIPRKKRRVESDSLISLMAPPSKAETAEVDEEEELQDPSEERDRLRKLLEEAEQLEVEATSLRRKLFGSRIVSRTDVSDLGTDVKSLKRVFPCGGTMAAIVDDREDVWANAENNDTLQPGEPPDNLLLVQPYHWKPFSGYRDVNNASGVDLSKSEDEKGSINNAPDVEENDLQLLWIADILKRLHHRFYASPLSQEEQDQQTVPNLLRSMRQEIFSQSPRVNIVFSGIIPIQQQNVKTKVRLPLVRYAEELGARILPDISQEVTHVVAKRDNSEKIKRARREIPGCYIVHPSWLMECYWSISRRDVGPHHMGPMPRMQHLKDRGRDLYVAPNKILLGDSEKETSEEDEVDDDFADDLEKEMMVMKE